MGLKLLHTADWHLGRIFHQVHLTEDQAFALAGLLETIAREKPDVVIVAGDIYDRAVPPPEAVELLDRTLGRIAEELETPIVLIPGNHDSATRLGFGAQLLKARGVYIISQCSSSWEPVVITSATGVVVEIFGIPYAEPAEVRQWLGDDSLRDHEAAMQAWCARLRDRFHPQRRQVLVSHAFVAGSAERDSERPLSVGGAGTVSVSAFAGFDYVALGHLHAPQAVGENAMYSGSLLKYSFSECDDEKCAVLVELPATGPVTRRLIPIQSRRDVRRICGALKDLISQGSVDPQRGDYLHITLTDEGAVLNAMPRLREVYPNVLHLERQFLEPREPSQAATAKRRSLSDEELFRDFYREVLNADVADVELSLFAEAVKSAAGDEVPG